MRPAVKHGWAVALALAASVAAAPIAGAAPSAVASGVYDNTLLLAVGPGGEVSGYFDMSQPGPPSFSCIFYLKGRLAGAAAAVATYFPEDPKGDLIRGALTAIGPGQVRVALPTEHGGCGNLWQFADKSTPADFKLQQAEPWTAVRVVKAAKAYFSPTPGAAHGRAYLVKGDGVGIRATQAGWVQADFIGEKHSSSGWLRESDLYLP
jgi:hypothetical protein